MAHITDWTAGGLLDWGTEAAMEGSPLHLRVEAIRLALIERVMVVAPATATSSFDIGTSPIWECVLAGVPMTRIMREIDRVLIAVVGLGFFGSQSAPDKIGWADGDDWTKPMDGLTTQGASAPVRFMSLDYLVEKVSGVGEPYYAVCDVDLSDVPGGFDVIGQTEFIPSCRWLKQKYDMINELTQPATVWQGTVAGYVDIVDNPIAYYARRAGSTATVCGDPPTTAEWVATEALWADVTGNIGGFEQWRQFGLGAYRKSNRSSTNQYFRVTIQPDFDMSDMSRQNVAGDDGFDFEKDVQVGVELEAHVDIAFLDFFSDGQFHAEVGALDTYYEISTQTGLMGKLWSAPQFPPQIAAPALDVPKFPQVFVAGAFCAGLWATRRSVSGVSGNSTDMYVLFDYDKPAGFRFK